MKGDLGRKRIALPLVKPIKVVQSQHPQTISYWTCRYHW